MMDKAVEQKEEKKYNRFQWFLMAFLIPLIFAVAVALIVMTFSGVNVFEKSKEIAEKIPVVSGWVENKKEPSTEEIEKEMIDLEAEVKDKEAELDQIETKMGNKDQEIERLQLEKGQLELQIDELTAIQEENKRAFKDIVRTYETMSAKKAAPIISKMSDAEALKILTNIKAETLAAIMENMSPEDAAKFTGLLTNESAGENE